MKNNEVLYSLVGALATPVIGLVTFAVIGAVDIQVKKVRNHHDFKMAVKRGRIVKIGDKYFDRMSERRVYEKA